jgi:hypothetical protein
MAQRSNAGHESSPPTRLIGFTTGRLLGNDDSGAKFYSQQHQAHDDARGKHHNYQNRNIELVQNHLNPESAAPHGT